MIEGGEFERVHEVVKRGLNRLEPEPLLEKPSGREIERLKNLGEMKSVYSYWHSRLEEAEGGEAKAELIKHMKVCANYGENPGNEHLEAASSEQHDRWARFVKAYEKNKVTPGHSDYDEDVAHQTGSTYEELQEKEKDLHRVIVAFVTSELLDRANA